MAEKSRPNTITSKSRPFSLLGELDVIVKFIQEHIVSCVVKGFIAGKIMLVNISYAAAAQNQHIIMVGAESEPVGLLLALVESGLYIVILMAVLKQPQRVDIPVEPRYC